LNSSAVLALFCLVVVPFAENQQSSNQKVKLPGQLPPQAQAQLKIDPAGSSDWHASTLSPKVLAAKTDAWLVQLRNVSGKTRFLFTNERGGFGVTKGEIAIVDATKFRVSFGHPFNDKKGPSLIKGEMIGDGFLFQRLDQDGWSKPTSVFASRLPKPLLSAWAKNYQELIFAGFGPSDRPLTAILKAALAAGFKATTEHRSGSVYNHPFSEDRILLNGEILSSGVKLKDTLEILIDKPTGALLNVVQTLKKGKKNQYQALWTVMWDRSPGQRFPKSLFVTTTK
jgi:hypothetical protein